MSIEPSPESTFTATDTLPTGAPAVGIVVPKLATRMSESEIVTALDLGHVAAFGVSPSEARMSVANAHVWQETTRGAHVWNFNMLNGDWLPGDPSDRFLLVADEGYGADAHSMRKYLRAFPDAFSGAVGYWQTMAGRYAAALPYFDAGDGDGAARELKLLRFFTGDVEIYARALRLMAAEWIGKRRDGRL